MSSPPADPRPLPAPMDPNLAAARLAEFVAVPAVRGDLALWCFRRALAWGLRRARAATTRAAADAAWIAPVGESRLRVTSLPHIQWTVVLESEGSAAAHAAGLVRVALSLRAEIENPTGPRRLRESCGGMFGTTLVPEPQQFRVHHGKGRHVIVGVGGAQWTVEVLREDGTARSEEEIACDFEACLDERPTHASPALAVTAAPRSVAASAWLAMERDSPEAAEQLREALFSVFFDPNTPADSPAVGRLAQAGAPHNRCCWHGFNLVVFANGKAAVVGSYVTGLEGEGAMELCGRLGQVRRPKSPPAGRKKGGRRGHDARPPEVRWTLDESVKLKLAREVARRPIDAGPYVRMTGFGRRRWRDAGVNPEAAAVVALRLALGVVLPELDELMIMLNLPHWRDGRAIRVGATTPELRALLSAVKNHDPDVSGRAAAALVAHKNHVRDHKQLASADVALFFSIFSVAFLSSTMRWILGFVTRWLRSVILAATPEAERPGLGRPQLAVDSSVPGRPGIALIGRFGVSSPPMRLWVHHSIVEDETSYVFQLPTEWLPLADPIREALQAAFDTLLAAVEANAPPVPVETTETPSTTRLAYIRLVGIGAALRPSRATKR